MDHSNEQSQASLAPDGATGAEKSTSRRVGVVAFVIGVISVLAGWIGEMASFALLISGGDGMERAQLSFVVAALVVVLGLAALILGIIGARRPVGKALSGAAIAMGAIGVLGWFFSAAGMSIVSWTFG
ncbi:hypothetical protein [Zhihengliuella halotolerans]|uniref:Uncharacterized protein n=1 Tax=Zhihengliuella halotolerans TaxID=370736 RepID=A0A4Q8AFB2_9MICC|nr:hypothetical protein [Zhihengliuella halotolerans]RZU62990.1 hypothetical protein EV380_2596 [Zhihengliuella halotolerans]